MGCHADTKCSCKHCVCPIACKNAILKLPLPRLVSTSLLEVLWCHPNLTVAENASGFDAVALLSDSSRISRASAQTSPPAFPDIQYQPHMLVLVQARRMLTQALHLRLVSDCIRLHRWAGMPFTAGQRHWPKHQLFPPLDPRLQSLKSGCSSTSQSSPASQNSESLKQKEPDRHWLMCHALVTCMCVIRVQRLQAALMRQAAGSAPLGSWLSLVLQRLPSTSDSQCPWSCAQATPSTRPVCFCAAESTAMDKLGHTCSVIPLPSQWEPAHR